MLPRIRPVQRRNLDAGPENGGLPASQFAWSQPGFSSNRGGAGTNERWARTGVRLSRDAVPRAKGAPARSPAPPGSLRQTAHKAGAPLRCFFPPGVPPVSSVPLRRSLTRSPPSERPHQVVAVLMDGYFAHQLSQRRPFWVAVRLPHDRIRHIPGRGSFIPPGGEWCSPKTSVDDSIDDHPNLADDSMTESMTRMVQSMIHSTAHSMIHSTAHSTIRSRTRSITHSTTGSRTRSITHSTTGSMTRTSGLTDSDGRAVLALDGGPQRYPPPQGPWPPLAAGTAGAISRPSLLVATREGAGKAGMVRVFAQSRRKPPEIRPGRHCQRHSARRH